MRSPTQQLKHEPEGYPAKLTVFAQPLFKAFQPGLGIWLDKKYAVQPATLATRR